MHHNVCLSYFSEGIYFLEHSVVNGQNTLGIYPKYTLSTDRLELLKQMFLQSIAFIKR